MCPLVCFHQVFGDEQFCDFCNEDDECECAGEDVGMDRLCCVNYYDDEPEDASEVTRARRADTGDAGSPLADGDSAGDGYTIATPWTCRARRRAT